MKQILSELASRLTEKKQPYQHRVLPNTEVLIIPCPVAPGVTLSIGCFAPMPVSAPGGGKAAFIEKADLSLRTMQVIHIPEEKHPQALEMMNTLNAMYRFGRFVLDEKHDVHLYMDMPAESEPVAEVALELLACSMQLLRSAYPHLTNLVQAR